MIVIQEGMEEELMKASITKDHGNQVELSTTDIIDDFNFVVYKTSIMLHIKGVCYLV